MIIRFLTAASIVLSAVSAATADPSPIKVDFNRDIRPILADKCYACHGPDDNKREAELRLDEQESAFAKRDAATIVPGKPEASELIRRVTSGDDDERMPPPKFRKELSENEQELLKAWIRQGANWEQHWSYASLSKPETPKAGSTWRTNVVDDFILAKMRKADFQPNTPADRVTLIRRLTFDLTGLPPKVADVDAFVKDQSPEAYERLVDRLLASKHYGERMALYWLDVARYADTNGYHGDNPRTMWLYRDFVIEAFNSNLPFDQFTVEQIAGDLLPETGRRGRIASAYNRLLQTTQEGGGQAKEYLAKYAADRVRNTANAWLGTTMGCVECHNHKYDPFTQEDFYSFAAFFADIDEVGIGGPTHTKILTPKQEQELKQLDKQLAELQKQLDTQTPELDAAQSKWEATVLEQARVSLKLSEWRSVGPFAAANFDEAHAKSFVTENQVIDLKAAYDGGKLKWIPQPKFKDATVHTLAGSNCATYLHRTIETPVATEVAVSLGSDDSIRCWLNGVEVLNKKVARGVAPDQEKIKLSLKEGQNTFLMKICNGGGGYGFYFRLAESGLPAPIAAIVRTEAEKRTPQQKKQLAAHYRSLAPELNAIRKQRAELAAKRDGLAQQGVNLVITKTRAQPRMTRVLPRGNWLDESGPTVQPAIPQHFGKLPVENRRPDRLDLAKWLVSPQNPLTARVFVNRVWMLMFGAGLSPNVDDLGSQGVAPSHPELLDWLAIDFIESGWDVKRLIKRLVMSSTYRQSSRANAKLQSRDPYNRYLARQGRWRLDAELVRDTALTLSGLLVEKVGGPSVKPYQPAGYWTHLKFPNRTWKHDTGESQYRRGLYTWWQRTFLHPSLLAFDAPTREECVAQRGRSNTPIQALVLLNDPTYVEASRKFAEQIVAQGGETPRQKVRFAMKHAVSREPSEREMEVLLRLYDEQRKDYAGDEPSAEQLLTVGLAGHAETTEKAELAAWSDVARTILNLYETITRY